MMNLKTAILSVLLLGLWTFAMKAQCPDFTDLNSSAVTGYAGSCGYIGGSYVDTILSVGIMPGRHTLITQQGTDPHTGGQLPFLPNGENVVVRLGNDQVHAQMESLVYTFTVNPDYPILLLKYAVVLEDPHHIEIEQPRFLIQALDIHDELLSECMEYNIVSSPLIPGFQEYNHVMWRPWTTNGFDLSAYAGQTVKFKITTYDCRAGGHYGYAYFTASCISNQISFSGCNGDLVTLSAPVGFESYSWNNGSHTLSTTYTILPNTVATCDIVTVTGCQITYSVLFTQDTTLQDYIYHDTICEGMNYHDHGFNLPVYSTPGDYIATNTYYDASDCIEGATNMLYLHVHPRYHHIYDVACEGGSYNAHGFHFTQLTQGEVTDTTYVSLPYGCDSITILHLTVNHTFSVSETINGPHEVCEGSLETFFLPNATSPTTTNYHWTVPDGVTVYIGQGTPNAQLYFTQNAPSSVQISLTADNGCGNSTIPFNIAVGNSYSNMFSDTVCTGSSYNQHGYQLGTQDTAGYYVHILNGTTQQGCDSISVLELFVAETPAVEALADPTEICVGSETNLFAVGSQASVTLPSQLSRIGIGDIMCTDSTFVHPQDWPCGKVAWGIVFHVDVSGQHGWVVSLNNEFATYRWATTDMDIPSITNYVSSYSTLEDQDGYQNTANMRISGEATQYPAAYSIDFNHGWYLPAAGQLYHLYAVLGIVNNSLQIVGVNPFPMNVNWRYWSSTESSASMAWFLDSNQSVVKGEKVTQMFVRAVRDF